MVVWFLTICSIVVHGLSIPLGKLGFFLPRTLSRAFTSQTNSQTNLAIGARVYSSNAGVLRERRRVGGGGGGGGGTSGSGTANGSVIGGTPALSSGTSSRPIYRIGGSIIRSGTETGSGVGGAGGSGLAVVDGSSPINLLDGVSEGRTIRFPDEEVHVEGGRVKDSQA